jgi:hypothetical protein
MIADAHHTSTNYEDSFCGAEKQTLKKNTKGYKVPFCGSPI